jgi:hypothetical protein
MLSEIVKARITISYYKAGQIRYPYEQNHQQRRERAQVFERYNPYRLKWDTIANCIFAVDIEASAVDIAKLRLWLSLVVEEDLTPSEDEQRLGIATRKDPHPLPSLDYNIMCGNSLIDEFEGVQLFDDALLDKSNYDTSGIKSTVQMSLFVDNMQILLDDLRREQERLFGEQTPSVKREIKRNIDKIIDSIIRAKLGRDNNAGGLQKYEEALKQKTKPYFLWKLEFARVFRENGGFDVVIGNPPYFNVETLGVKSTFVDYLKSSYSDIWMDKSDILFYFVRKSFELSNGQVNFIISNAFLFSNKARKLRNFIVEYLPLRKIVNFEKHMIFSNASITSCLCFFDKKHRDRTQAVIFPDALNDLTVELLSSRPFGVTLKKDSVFALSYESIDALNRKIDSNYAQLTELFKIGSGMQTGANDVFIFKDKPSNFQPEFFKKHILGKNINKYYLSSQPAYILYVEDTNSLEELPQTIRDYLAEHRKKLAARAQIVRTPGSKWWKYTFSMHRDLYHLPKIWCSYRNKYNVFALDETSDYIGLTNTTVIFDSNPTLSLKYLLALLNSKLLSFRYKTIGKQTGGGIFEYFPNAVGRLPIPDIAMKQQEAFIELVDRIQYLKIADSISDTSAIEADIDKLVYELYGLTGEEIKIVEENVK